MSYYMGSQTLSHPLMDVCSSSYCSSSDSPSFTDYGPNMHRPEKPKDRPVPVLIISPEDDNVDLPCWKSCNIS